MERVANSTPMVDLESTLNSLRVNRDSKLDLPTPESPMSTTVVGGGVGVEERGGRGAIDGVQRQSRSQTESESEFIGSGGGSGGISGGGSGTGEQGSEHMTGSGGEARESE